jgi:hypothetical protein
MNSPIVWFPCEAVYEFQKGGGRMARLNITMQHHQPPEVARAKFQAAIQAFESRYSTLVHQIDWANDGQSATIAGAGFDVRCWYDDHDVHVQGSIPLAWKLFESAIRSHIKSDIERALPAHRLGS